jgi:hypothetical protein
MADVNMYTQDGEEVVVGLMVGETWYVGIGTDDTEAVKGDADLVSASNEARSSCVATNTTADIAQYVGSITDTTGQTVKEIGLFTTAGAGTPPSGGVLIARGNKAAGWAVMLSGDIIQITVTIEQT